MNDDYKLVYSSDPIMNKKCSKCKELQVECCCLRDEEVTQNRKVCFVRLEKSGRAGKTVTIIDQLPRNQNYLKNLTHELKKSCGVGGSFVLSPKGGSVEIQGDKREMIRVFLIKKGILFKGLL